MLVHLLIEHIVAKYNFKKHTELNCTYKSYCLFKTNHNGKNKIAIWYGDWIDLSDPDLLNKLDKLIPLRMREIDVLIEKRRNVKYDF